MSRSSWGYRVLGRMDFPNAFAGATVSPRIGFAHDVNGSGPTFNEGVKALTLGVGFNYRQNWQADIAYTTYFGGRKYGGSDPLATPAANFPPGQVPEYASGSNPLADRDFLAVSLSYSF